MDLPLCSNVTVSSLNVSCIQDEEGWYAVAPQAGRSRARFPMVSLEIFIDIIDSASNRNEYQEHFLAEGVKAECA